MAYEASTELARRRRDLAIAREKAMSEFNLAGIGRRYGTAAQNLESNLEARGILRSGEAMRGRTELGAAEKAERAGELMRSQGAMDTTELDYAEVLARAMAAGGGAGGVSMGSTQAVAPVAPASPASAVSPVAPGAPVTPTRPVTPTTPMTQAERDREDMRMRRNTQTRPSFAPTVTPPRSPIRVR